MPLRGVHREVSLPQDGFCGLVTAPETGDADARADEDVFATDADGLANCLQDTARRVGNVVSVPDIFEQDGELIPTKPGKVSDERTQSTTRRAMVQSSSSPAECPRLSLTFLKSSRSRNMTA